MTSRHVVLILSLFVTGAALDAVEVPLNRFYPQEAVLVSVADRSLLQTRLDQHGIIRLAAGDYATGNTLAKLVVRSGNRIYGLGNDMPPIEIQAGTTGAVLSGLHSTFTFPASASVTSQNLFRRCTNSTFRITNATVQDNLFLDASFSKLFVDHSAGGHWRGNRFVRFLNHSDVPMISVRGSVTSRPLSHGNTFVFMNSLGASYEIGNVADQRDLNIVYIDCESYSRSGANALTFRNIDDLTLFGTYGAIRTGRVIDQGATSFWVHGHEMGTYEAPNLVQTANNTTSIVSNFNPDMGTPSNSGSNQQRFRLFNNTNSATKVLLANESTLTTPLTNPQETAFMRAISSARTDPAWERPQFNPIPDPGGPSWSSGRESRSSSRATIQAEINSKGIAFLAPGIYYLDGPLVLGPGKGLVGSGAENTLLIAKNSTIDLIVDDGTTGSTRLYLADLTLQGGRSGIRHTTPGAQFTSMTLSHVTIRDMADSGIWTENIYAWDNNFIDFVNITRCPAGIKQRAPTGSLTDASPNLSYLDKNVFYQCQFVACGKALDLISNRPSNGNVWVNCLFQNNTQYVCQMRSHNGVVFANCDFINNNGHPVVNSQGQLFLTGCAFSDTNSGATDFIDGIAMNVEGCTFSKSGSSSVVMIAPNPTWTDLTNPANLNGYRNHNTYFFNCVSTNVPLGLIFSGLVVNSHFYDRPELSVRAAIITNEGGTVTTLAAGAVNPATVRTQLLVGNTFSRALVAEVPEAVPSITSATNVAATVASPLAYFVAATNSPTSFQATGLPAWLTLNPSSGLISGTPPANGTTTVNVTATNFVGTSASQAITITATTPPLGAPAITSAANASGALGQAFSYQITATNSPTGFSIDGTTSLPPGLSLNLTSGLISGTPSAIGVTSVLLQATNATATTGKYLLITIAPAASAGDSSGPSSGGGGGSGCGIGGTAAVIVLSLGTLFLRRRRL